MTAGAADDWFLYGFGGNQLRRVPLAGGAPAVVVDDIDTSLDFDLLVDAVDDTSVYLMAGPAGPLLRFAKTGGPGVPIFTPPSAGGPPGLRADGTSVYVIAGSPPQLWRVARDGTGAVQLAAGERPFVVAGDSVYFSSGGNAMRVCKCGCRPSPYSRCSLRGAASGTCGHTPARHRHRYCVPQGNNFGFQASYSVN